MGVDVDGLRTDAIMLASFDTETKEVNMLSIPRDTKMYIGNRYQKINAAHAFVDESGEIGSKIYPWVFYEHKKHRGVEGAKLLLEKQYP